MSDVQTPTEAPDLFLFFTKDVMRPAGDQESSIKLKSEWNEEAGTDPIIEGYGSTEIEDSDRDVMSEAALRSMCDAPVGMNTWIDHTWKTDFLLGSLVEQPRMTIVPKGSTGNGTGRDVAGLWIATDIEMEVEKAARQYRLIRKGRRFGFSGGFIYEEIKKRTDAKGRVIGVTVLKVRPIEFSCVGMPANPASWVQYTVKGLQMKGVLPYDDNAEAQYIIKHAQDWPVVEAGQLEQVARFLKHHYEDTGVRYTVIPMLPDELVA